MQEILILGNLGFNSCFWKSYHHILMHFVPQCQCFKLFLNVFSKTVFFLKFSEPLPISIDPIYFSINRNLKFFFFNEPLSVSIDWNCFSINRNSWIRFFKNSYLTCSNHFFKTFQNFFLSLRLGKAPQRFFVVFLQIFCKVFLSQGR